MNKRSYAVYFIPKKGGEVGKGKGMNRRCCYMLATPMKYLHERMQIDLN